MPAEFPQLVGGLAPYDQADLLAAVGALGLLPENAGRLVRLYAFAHACACQTPTNGKPTISQGRLRALLNGPPLAGGKIIQGEDPFDSVFVQDFAFHGGSYRVLPDFDGEEVFNLRQLTHAIFWGPEAFPNPDFVASVRRLVTAVLELSTEVTLRSQLDVRTDPSLEGHADVFVPASAKLDKLKQAVRFNSAYLDELLASAGSSLQDLEPLVTIAGSLSADSYDMDDSPFFLSPVVRVGEEVLVPLPRKLISALLTQIIRLAQVHEAIPELARRYQTWIAQSVIRSMDYLGCPLGMAKHVNVSTLTSVQELYFSLDSDKAAICILVTDTLSDYDANDVSPEWHLHEELRALPERIRALESELYQSATPPTESLLLVVVQGPERDYVLPLDEVHEATSSRLLMLSAGDLETMALLEAGNRLSLWNYAGARTDVREHARVIHIGSELNEFDFFRHNGYSYYAGQNPDAPHTLLLMSPGGAGSARREVHKRLEPHAAPAALANRVTEVVRMERNSTTPAFVRLEDLGRRVALLLEAPPAFIWVLAPENDLGALHGNYAQLADAIVYWLAQFTPSMQGLLMALSSRALRTNIHLVLDAEVDWSTVPEPGTEASNGGVNRTNVSVETGDLTVTFGAELNAVLFSADNVGERAFMREILRGLRALACQEAQFPDEIIDEMIDRHAPIGLKKKLFIVQAGDAPELDGRGLPVVRFVQEFQTSAVLDDLANQLRDKPGFTPGRIPDGTRSSFVNQEVTYLFSELRALVACLEPTELLGWLVRHNEALVHDYFEKRITIPTSLACYGSDRVMLEEIQNGMAKHSQAALAARFLAEYVAAQPPFGIRSMSVAVLDRLQALALQIINLGFESDVIHLGLADIGLTLLPNGRVTEDRTAFHAAREAYMPLFARAEIGRAVDDFPRHWREDANHPVDFAVLDPAATVEFGYSLTELVALYRQLIGIAMDSDQLIAAMPVDDLVQRLAAALAWPIQAVQGAIDLLALSPRSDFFKPPAPYGKPDVFPWRFNRGLSYLRRPLVVTRSEAGDQVTWGARHTRTSAAYFIDLCLSGRVQAQTMNMRQAMGRLNAQAGEDFNDEVANSLQALPHLLVRRRLKKIGKRRIAKQGEDLGDIDVLVANAGRRSITLVECKDLALARTPRELANELENLFVGGKDKSTVQHHSERIEWVREHLIEVLTALNLPTGKWQIDGLIVVSRELFSPLLRRTPIPVIPVDRLAGDHRFATAK